MDNIIILVTSIIGIGLLAAFLVVLPTLAIRALVKYLREHRE